VPRDGTHEPEQRNDNQLPWQVTLLQIQPFPRLSLRAQFTGPEGSDSSHAELPPPNLGSHIVSHIDEHVRVAPSGEVALISQQFQIRTEV